MSRLSKDLEHTLRAWINRVGTDTFHSIYDVFPGDAPAERGHRRNCRLLVRKGLLEPEQVDTGAPVAKRMSTHHLMSERFRCSA